MKRNKVIGKLTVSYILDNVNQEDIFATYSGFSTAQISSVVGTNKKLSAPYRRDSDPSFGFTYRNNGKLIGRDFGGYFWGDCFDYVGFTLNLDARDRDSFGKIMEDIAKTFGIHKYKNGTHRVNYKKLDIKIKKKPKLLITTITREWNSFDGEYWFDKYGVSRGILNEYNIVPILYLYFNGNCIYTYDYDDPAYGYYLGHKDRIEYWKIYYPMRPKGKKFHSNGGIVQGIMQIKPANFGVITKSLKDVVTLQALSVQAIAPASEGGIVTKKQIEYIKSKWNYIVSLMDFDDEGRNMARRLRREYNIPSLFITDGRFHTFNFGNKVKDISDYRDKYGGEQTMKLVKAVIDNDFEFTYEFFQIISGLKHY